MSQNQRPARDELTQQIVLNEIHKTLALDCATYFLTESVARLRLNPELPDTPIVLAAHALIAHNEWMHDLDRDRLNVFADKLEVLVESLKSIIHCINCANEKSPDFWMASQLAAIEKANEIGLVIPPEWSLDDLRYKLHQVIYGGSHG
jgi:hypothetical protein